MKRLSTASVSIHVAPKARPKVRLRGNHFTLEWVDQGEPCSDFTWFLPIEALGPLVNEASAALMELEDPYREEYGRIEDGNEEAA